jgi:hypothetical protein
MHALQSSFSQFTAPVSEKVDNLLRQRRFHIVAPSPNYDQMDIAFFAKKGQNRSNATRAEITANRFLFKDEDKHMFLIFIGINNRYTWALQILRKNVDTIKNALNIFTSFPNFRKPTAPSATRAELAGDTPIGQSPLARSAIYIDCDGEKSFKSIHDRSLLTSGIYKATNANIIITSQPDPYHNRLSLVNRIIRTIRDYAMKFFRTLDEITREQLEHILKYYNNSPHKTLSNLIGFNVSPAMVLKDVELEGFIARKLMYFNLEQERKKLKIGDIVRVIHEADPKNPFEKIRYRMEPGFFTVKGVPGGTDSAGRSSAAGMKNNMYIVERQASTDKSVPWFYPENTFAQLIVPGYFLSRVL